MPAQQEWQLTKARKLGHTAQPAAAPQVAVSFPSTSAGLASFQAAGLLSESPPPLGLSSSLCSSASFQGEGLLAFLYCGRRILVSLVSYRDFLELA